VKTVQNSQLSKGRSAVLVTCSRAAGCEVLRGLEA
jgi:hypothetical protein